MAEAIGNLGKKLEASSRGGASTTARKALSKLKKPVSKAISAFSRALRSRTPGSSSASTSPASSSAAASYTCTPTRCAPAPSGHLPKALTGDFDREGEVAGSGSRAPVRKASLKAGVGTLPRSHTYGGATQEAGAVAEAGWQGASGGGEEDEDIQSGEEGVHRDTEEEEEEEEEEGGDSRARGISTAKTALKRQISRECPLTPHTHTHTHMYRTLRHPLSHSYSTFRPQSSRILLFPRSRPPSIDVPPLSPHTHVNTLLS